VLDDGFQHRRLGRDLDVVLVAVEDGWPGKLLPRGPYRERPSALARADVVLVTRRTAAAADSGRLAARIEAQGAVTVVGGVELAIGMWTDLDGRPVDAPEGDVLAACAIARPDAFRSAVGRLVTGSVELVAFADHHEYTPADLERLAVVADGRPMAITEKDAVKLRALGGTRDDVRVLTEEVRWDWGEEAFLARLGAVAPVGRAS
jgi:tetraacyldisaccharide 4'-kinase